MEGKLTPTSGEVYDPHTFKGKVVGVPMAAMTESERLLKELNMLLERYRVLAIKPFVVDDAPVVSDALLGLTPLCARKREELAIAVLKEVNREMCVGEGK